MTFARQRVGRTGEKAAADYLESKGYTVVARNYRNPIGEIDLIVSDGVRTIFVEVKAKTGIGRGSPQEMVDRRKQAKIKRVIRWYLMEQKQELSCRVDVIALQWEGETPYIEHIEHAFELV